jgi:outer membrane protein insertion porin family
MFVPGVRRIAYSSMPTSTSISRLAACTWAAAVVVLDHRAVAAGTRRACRAARALVASFVIVSILTQSALAAPHPIESVEVHGNRRITADTIRTHLLLSPGQPFDAARANQSIKALFATGHFSDVRIEHRGRKLVVTVVEAATVESIALKGNAAIASDKLENALQLKKGAPFTRAKAQADARRLRDHYRKEGYYQATVEPLVTEVGNDQVDVVFAISEGALNKVRSISFVGNRAFTEDQLRDVITTTQSGWLDVLKKNLTYDEERLVTDRELLRRHYQGSGYADASISQHQAELDPASGTFAITFTIEEGERYAFGAVSVVSDLPGVDTGGLQEFVGPKAGDTYNAVLVEKTVDKLSLALADKGHGFARVAVSRQRDAAARTMGVTFRIEDGPHLFIERIEISGNTKTKDHVIRRELRMEEGDPFTPVRIEAARRRLVQLGFFTSVDLKTSRGSAPDKVNLAVLVVEQDTRDLSFGVGYSSNEGVIGDISLSDSNLFGNGQMVRLKLAASQTRQQLEFGFTEPHFLGSNVAAGFDLFYKDIDHSRQSSYKADRAGAVARLGFALDENWSSTVRYSFVRNHIYDVGESASAAIKEAANSDGGTYYTSAVGYSVAYDTRDKKKLPTSGSYLSTSQDLAGVGGDTRYLRSTVDGRYYYPVSDGVTLAARFTGGTIGGWGGQDVRLLDLFQLGGETVRGFAPSGIGPRDTASANNDALGGRHYVATTAEARFNLPFVPEELGLRGATFVDAGSLWGPTTFASSLPGTVGDAAALRASVGAGLVWASPVGALRVDYAVPLVKEAFDKTQPLSFGAAGF